MSHEVGERAFNDNVRRKFLCIGLCQSAGDNERNRRRNSLLNLLDKFFKIETSWNTGDVSEDLIWDFKICDKLEILKWHVRSEIKYLHIPIFDHIK